MLAAEPIIESPKLLPLLRWAGGKRALAPMLAAEIVAQKPRLYIEPFLGGGAVMLALPPEMPKVVADINRHLIDFWMCVALQPQSLVNELRAVERGYPETNEGFLAAREEFNNKVDHPRRMWIRRSALFAYLNARCFNGLWRANASGRFNVPYGKLAAPRKLQLDEVIEIGAALKQCDLRSDPFQKILGELLTKRVNAVKGDPERVLTMAQGFAVYADPPYDGTFDGYDKDGFGEPEQQQLSQLLASYSGAGAAVWASNADTPRVREIYSWAQIETLDEHHSVGSKADRRGKRSCVLIRGGAARADRRG